MGFPFECRDVFRIVATTCTVLSVLVCCCLNARSQASQTRPRSIADDFAKAFDHGARVRSEAACSVPHPMMVYVNQTDPSKVYLPRGTVLHRCSDLTSCCQNPSETC